MAKVCECPERQPRTLREILNEERDISVTVEEYKEILQAIAIRIERDCGVFNHIHINSVVYGGEDSFPPMTVRREIEIDFCK